jgi:hypothetical protein
MANKKAQTLERARVDFAAYAVAMYRKLELANHTRELISVLERVALGELDRVIVTMPPRMGKSLITSKLFPAWFMGRNPDKSIIAVSYSQEFVTDFGREVRRFASERLHRAIFPECIIAGDSDSARRFHTTQGGAYFAVGAGGPLMGRGADLLLIDDPIKNREEANSAAVRRGVQSWYESSAYTRLMTDAAIVLIQTRWHEDDLAGWLLREHASEGWVVVNFPAIAERDEDFRSEGEALWPEKFPLETLARIK